MSTAQAQRRSGHHPQMEAAEAVAAAILAAAASPTGRPTEGRRASGRVIGADTRLQQVTAPSAFCSSLRSTPVTTMPAASRRCRVRGKQAG